MYYARQMAAKQSLWASPNPYLFKTKINITELNARILNELIEKIVVHEKEIINGKKYQTVEIYYKFVGLV